MAKYIDNTNLGYLISKIKAAFWPKTDVTNVTLADVAVTGDYDDLINKPVVDSTPTAGSTNLVMSGGVKAALDGKQNTISDLSTIRSGASAGATAVQPAELSAGLATKQDILTFDTTPTQGSTNPVTSGGIYNVIGDIETLLAAI